MGKYGKVFKNPLLEPLFSFLQNMEIEGYDRLEVRLASPVREMFAWCVQNASWRRMLPTQPTVTCIFSVSCFVPRNEEVWDSQSEHIVEKRMKYQKEETYSGPNVRMGRIFDELERMLERLLEPNAFALTP